MRNFIIYLLLLFSTPLYAQNNGVTIKSGGSVKLEDGAQWFINRAGIRQEGGSFGGGEVFIVDRDLDGINFITAETGIDFGAVEFTGDAQIEMTGTIQVSNYMLNNCDQIELNDAQVFIFPDAFYEGSLDNVFGFGNSFIRVQRRDS